MARLRHILRADQFDRFFLDRMEALTNRIRMVRKSTKGAIWLKSLFPDRAGMLYFKQASTRTRVSFQRALQMLGVDIIKILDATTSSEIKGESDWDSIRTQSSYVDVIVMRVNDKGFAARMAEHLDGTPRPVPVINGGSGPDEHPTQALLDDYTLRRSFKEYGGIDGMTIALVGDLKRGRTVRSLAQLMQHYKDVKLLLVSPPEFAMETDIIEFLEDKAIAYQITDEFDLAVEEADAVYLTRIQKEHDAGGESGGVDVSRFCFTERHLKILKPQGIVMHPLPRVEELDYRCDADPRVKIWRQERNGMFVRTALLYRIMSEQKLEKKWKGELPKHMQDPLWVLPEME
ncbi:MAG: aspartate carbamoyltransferase [Patescibacteria group bacterium]